MNILNKTLKSGFTMPVVGKGTWATTRRKKNHIDLDVLKRVAKLNTLFSNGITYIDTAQRYNNGYEETLIGKALKEIRRDKLFLASKVSSDNLSYDGVKNSAKATIKRMNCSYLDLYLIHEFNPELPLKETMRAMDYLLEKKMIKNIGVCDFTAEQLKAAQSYTKNKIVANQLRYSMLSKEAEKTGIIDYCQKNDIMIIAWRPFQKNLLKEKKITLLEELSKKYNKTPMQIALMWLISQKNVVVLAKITTQEKTKEITQALDLKITAEDLKTLTLLN